MMYSFFVTIHPQPSPGGTLEASISLHGKSVRPLRVEPDALSAARMDCSFEVAARRLGQLERMFCEPDGSFVWVSSQGDVAWQVDGNLYDRDGRLLFVDLKGTCPPEQFDRLLSALGWPATKLVFQLTREAIFLGEGEFRGFAAVE